MYSGLHENYYMRNDYLKKNRIPNQRVIKEKMGDVLADVMFKVMPPITKIYAGLEPVMKGAGKDLYQDPQHLLKMKSCLVPVKRNILHLMTFTGIDEFGRKVAYDREMRFQQYIEDQIRKNDLMWRRKIMDILEKEKKEILRIEKRKQLQVLNKMDSELHGIFQKSIHSIETSIHDAYLQNISDLRTQICNEMKILYRKLLKKQNENMTNIFKKRYKDFKNNQRSIFIEQLQFQRAAVCKQLHDINKDEKESLKYVRKQWELANLASQLYVGTEERRKCMRILKDTVDKFEANKKVLIAEINGKDEDIKIVEDEIEKATDYDALWQQKLWPMVKELKNFITFCMSSIPEQSKFFANLEALFAMEMDRMTNEPASDAYNMFECTCEQSNWSYDETKSDDLKELENPFIVFTGREDIIEKNFCECTRQTYCPCGESNTPPPVYVFDNRLMFTKCKNLEINTKKFLNYDEIIKTIKDYEEEENVIIGATPIESSIMEEYEYCEHIEDFNCSVWKNFREKDYICIDVVMSDPEVIPYKCINKVKRCLLDHLPPYMLNQKGFACELKEYVPCKRSTIENLLHTDEVSSSTTTSKEELYFNKATQCKIPRKLSEDDRPCESGFKNQDEDSTECLFNQVVVTLSNMEAQEFAAKRFISLQHMLQSSPSLRKLFYETQF